MLTLWSDVALPAPVQDSADDRVIYFEVPAKLPEDLKLEGGAEMYAAAYTQGGRLTHSKECQKAFRRYDWKCSRCCQLMRGAAPRGSWHRRYIARKISQIQERLF